MRIVIDLDGTLCETRRADQSYSDVAPIPEVVEAVRRWHAAGHTIVVQTARHMLTCKGDVGKILARVGLVTLEWLKQHEIPYDEIYFGKPLGDIYLDDRAVRYDTSNGFGLGMVDEALRQWREVGFAE